MPTRTEANAAQWRAIEAKAKALHQRMQAAVLILQGCATEASALNSEIHSAAEQFLNIAITGKPGKNGIHAAHRATEDVAGVSQANWLASHLADQASAAADRAREAMEHVAAQADEAASAPEKAQ